MKLESTHWSTLEYFVWDNGTLDDQVVDETAEEKILAEFLVELMLPDGGDLMALRFKEFLTFFRFLVK